MVLGLLKKGDEVLNVTNEFVAIKRKHGGVDIVPLIQEGRSWRVQPSAFSNSDRGIEV